MITAQSQRWEKTAITAALIFIWALVVVTPLSLMMASHMVPLPAPAQPRSPVDVQSASLLALAASRTNGNIGNGWKVVHVLVTGCPCSSFTAESLAARKPSSDCQEIVFIVGGMPEWKQALVQSGFEVQYKDGEQLARDTGIEGGPWLLLISPEGKIAYSGGYAGQRPRPGLILEDVRIMRAAFAGKTPPAYPAYGCASTPLLQGRLDPLGVCQNIK